MMAVLVALVGVFGLGTVIFQATATGTNQGQEATRATVYAQDKMEKLLSLGTTQVDPVSSPQFPCAETSPPPQCNTTGISGAGWATGLLAGGQTGPLGPEACPSGGLSMGYVDSLDANGTQLQGSSCGSITSPVAYVRMWQIDDLTPFTGGPARKQVTVAVYAINAVSKNGGQPIVVVTSVISNPN